MIRSYLARKPALIIALACLVQWALLFAITTPAWDAAFYYAYARSVVFDGDLQIENDLQLSYPTTAPDFAAKGLDQEKSETGRVATPFAIGSGLIWLPWLALLRLGAGVVQSNLNGYEWYFTAGLATFSMLLGWLAHWFGYRIARVEYGRFAALAAAITVLFATPLLYYQYREPLYSHATSAFITGLVILIWWRTHRKLPGSRYGVLLGGVIGLAALVRWQHIVYLALPAVSTFLWWFSLPNRQRKAKIGPAARYLLVVTLAALALLSLQLVHWRIIYGTWLTVPQGSTFLDWRAPFLLPLLFSTFRGLLPWMPVLLLALIGLLANLRRRAALVAPLLAVLLLEIYVNGSTRDWFAGAGFGPRRFTSELVIIIVGFAALLRMIPGRLRTLIAAIGGLSLAVHQWILLRYGLLERIGGRNLSMSPTFDWVDRSYGEFIQEVGAHLPDLLRTPFDFFVLPGSPIRFLTIDVFPLRHILALVATLVFILIGWRISRWGSRRIQESWIFISLIGLLLIVADLWLFVWG